MPPADARPARKELPDRLTTARLVMRPPQIDDAPAINEAICDSFAELHAWMEWAREVPSLDDTRLFCAEAICQRAEGKACSMLMLLGDGTLAGMTGYARVDWEVPAFEIGYWCRTACYGRGYVTEAAGALTRHAFHELGANRVQIRMDHRNVRSAAVAERLGFELEGVLRHEVRDHHGWLRDTRVYALLGLAGDEPARGRGAQPR